MVSESDFRAFILENWQNSSKISDILITKVYIRNTLEFQSHVPSCRVSDLPRASGVQFSELINASVLLFGRTIKYCVTNMARRSQNRARKFPTSLSTLSYKTPVFPTDSTLQYHKSNTLEQFSELDSAFCIRVQ